MRKSREHANAASVALTDDMIAVIRKQAEPFNEKCPLMVPKSLYADLKKDERFKGLMHKVRAIEDLPHRPKPRRKR